MVADNPRKYGEPPYSVVLVHGGPGAPGEMKPVAEEISKDIGVLEPFQTKDSIKGQVEELKQQIIENTETPIALVGWSWGAWLAFITAAKHPELVKKLILVSSGPFEGKYATGIIQTRLSRLSGKERERVEEIMKEMRGGKLQNNTFKEFGYLMDKADSFSPLSSVDEDVDFQPEIYSSVWEEAAKLRLGGKLLNYGKLIKCPVTVIHGEYDPHPFEGVKKPLSKVLKNPKFILLRKCGHHPWKEKEAKSEFYKTLRKEL